MKIKYLKTPRLELRIVTPEVHNHAMENFSDCELMDFFGLDEAGLEKQKSRQAGGLTTFNKSFVNFYPVEKSSGKVIGWCGYHTWYIEHNRAEIGYYLNAEEHKRKGYMSEILQAVLTYGFNQMNLHRVEALTATYNTASIKTLEKFGFTYEGLLREHYLVDGIHEDSPIYSLLRHEFPGTVQVCEATLQDIDAMSVIRLSVKENPLNNPDLVTRRDYEDYLTSYGKGWVAEVDGKIAGFAIVGLQQKNIWALFVDPSHEKAGVGRKLHDTMMDWYFTQTDEDVWLSTDPQTHAAEFYRRKGWRESGMIGNELKFVMSALDWKR